MIKSFRFDGFTIFLDEKTIKNEHEDDIEIMILHNHQEITLPYFVIDADIDENGEYYIHHLISSGYTTLKSLKSLAHSIVSSRMCTIKIN